MNELVHVPAVKCVMCTVFNFPIIPIATLNVQYPNTFSSTYTNMLLLLKKNLEKNS